MARFQDQILDENLVPIANATIWVFIVAAGTTNDQQAALTDDLGAAIIQPLVSDVDGLFYYNVTDGVYENEVHYGGQKRYVQQVLVGQATGIYADGDKGDITVSNGGVTFTIDPKAVTFPKMADLPGAGVVIGRKTSGPPGPPEVVDGQTLTYFLFPFTATEKGVVPPSGGGSTKVLRADGTWAALAPIAYSGAGGDLIDASVSPTAKLSAITSARILGRKTAGTGPVELLTGTQITSFIDTFGGGANIGLVPASPGGVTSFLRADGAWASPPQFSITAPGYAPVSPGTTTQFLRADGFWAVPPGSVAGGTDDTPYGPSWDGSTGISPSQNAVYDKIQSLGNPAALISDIAYGPAWDAVANIAPSQNAVFDKMVSVDANIGARVAKSGDNMTGDLTNAGKFVSANADAAQPWGFSHTRAGRVGYHLYNAGASTEWVIWQPAHAVGDNLRISSRVGGVDNDILTISPGGLNVAGDLTVTKPGDTGYLWLGNTGHTLYWDATRFNLNGDLLVNGGTTISATAISVGNNLFLQYVGGTGYFRTTTGDLWLGANGNNYFKISADGSITQPGLAPVKFGGTVTAPEVHADAGNDTGAIYFGTPANGHYLYYNSVSYVFGGNVSLSVGTGNFFAGNVYCKDVIASRGNGTGVVFFSAENSNRYLFYNGTNYDFTGAELSINGTRAFRHADPSRTSSAIQISTAAPAGGANGDIWLKI